MLALVRLTVAAVLLSLWPESLTLQQGQTATVSIQIEGAEDLYAADVSIVPDNPKIVSVVAMRPDGVLSADSTLRDGRGGQLAWSRAGQVRGFTGNGHLATVQIEALYPGTTALRLSGGSFYNSQGEKLACELSPEPVVITVTRAPLSERLWVLAQSHPREVGFLLMVAVAVLLAGVVMIVIVRRLWTASRRT